MAQRALNVGLVTILATMLWMGASAQSSTCTTALISLSPCLNYITGNVSTPSSSCCSQLGTVVQSEPLCLCMVLNASSLGININQTLALALPGACKVQTPPLSQCTANGGSPSSPPTPSAPSGGGSSEGTSAQIPFSLLFSLLFFVAYLSTPLTSY